MASRETFPESLTELSREALIEWVLELEAQLAEAQAQIAELRRQLFGSKAEKLSADEQARMDELASDLQEEAQKPPPLSQKVLEEERRDQRRRRAAQRPVRHPVPPVLETETVTLELAAEEKLCPPLRPPEAAHRRRSYRRDRPDSGQADPPPHGAPEVRLPLWGSRRDDRALAAAPDSAEQARPGPGRASAARALR
jgi:hypothetical protein